MAFIYLKHTRLWKYFQRLYRLHRWLWSSDLPGQSMDNLLKAIESNQILVYDNGSMTATDFHTSGYIDPNVFEKEESLFKLEFNKQET